MTEAPPTQASLPPQTTLQTHGGPLARAHLWYCACSSWNSSLMRSQESEVVNLSCCGRWEEPCGVQEGEQRPAPPMPHFLGCGFTGSGSQDGAVEATRQWGRFYTLVIWEGRAPMEWGTPLSSSCPPEEFPRKPL